MKGSVPRLVAVASGLLLLASAAPAFAFTPDSWYTQGITASLTPPVVTWGAPAAGTASGGSGSTSGTGAAAGSGGSTTAAAGGTGSGTSGSVTLTGQALEVFNWTNQLRAQHGLAALADNQLLDQVAQAKCQDMVNNNYFGDVSPTYGTALQLQQAFGVNAPIMGGENLAGAATAALAFFMLETSPPHLANLLYPTYTDVGTAVVPVGGNGVYVCQEFTGSGAGTATGSGAGSTTGAGTATGSGAGSTAGTGTATGSGAGSTAGAGTATGSGAGSTSGTGTATGSGAGSTSGTGAAAGGTGSGTSGSVTLTGQALEVFNWTNQLRVQHGLAALADNQLLDQVALAKCQDMVNNNYFGDVSPTYGTALQLQQAFGVNAPIMGGENLAGAATAALAFFMLETSPPHLANLLYPTYTDVGTAVVPVGSNGVYVCQEFTGS